MTSSLEFSGRTAGKNVGNVIMLMLIRVAHIAAVENQRMIEQGSITVRYGFQLVEEVRQHLDVITVDLGVIRDLVRILCVMRSSMKACVGPAERVASIREVPRAQKRCHSRDVALKR